MQQPSMHAFRLTVLAGAIAAGAGMAAQAQPATPAQLAPIVVRDAPHPLDASRGDAYVATRASAALKSQADLLETAQTVNVVTRAEMERQGSTSVAQALRYTPGVIAQYGDTDVRHDWLTIRGFTPARYLDGLVLPFGARGYAQPRIETYGLERIDVLKGPASGLYGQSAPGGLIDMTSKRANGERVREIELQLGSHARRQLGFDLGGQANEAGTVSYRVTGVGRRSDTPYDHVDDDKAFLQAALAFQLSPRTRLEGTAQYQRIVSDGGGGAPALPVLGTLQPTSAGTIARSRYVGDPDYDRFTNTQTFVGYTLEHRFSEHTGFRQTARISDVDTDSRRVQIGLMASPTQAVRYAWAFPESARAFQIDNQFHTALTTGPLRHRVLAGVDYLRETAHFTESQLNILTNASGGYALFDPYAPQYGDFDIATPPDGLNIDQRRSQLGAYVQDQIEWDRLHVVLSARHDRVRLDTHSRQAAGTTTDANGDINRTTFRTGASYVFDSGVAPYVNYATSFQPVPGSTRTGAALRPTTGKQVEAGIKVQPEGSRALLTLAAFQITQDNVSAPDPQNTRFSVQTGQVRARGLELEGKASVNDSLDVSFSYALTDSEITRTNAADTVGQVGNRMAFVPRHQASVWADYTVRSGPLAGLGLGAGVRYRGSFFGDLNNTHALRPVTLVDAGIRYDLGQASARLRGMQLALNVSNLFDKTYVANCLGATGCYWGTERTAVASLRYRW